MINNVDWISISVPMALDDSDMQSLAYSVQTALNPVPALYGVVIAETTVFGGGRKPFDKSLQTPFGITVWYSSKINYTLLEFSGKGCQFLRERNLLDSVLRAFAGKFTRIDVASDLLIPDSVFSFLPEKNVPARIKSKQRHVSATGETLYIGSMQSSEYTRVYRYYDPHPRSKFLRVETVYRKPNANDVATILLTEGFEPLVRRTGSRCGITDSRYEYSPDAPEAKFYRPDNGGSNTYRWLINSAAPAFRRLVREGIIENPEDFLLEHFVGK